MNVNLVIAIKRKYVGSICKTFLQRLFARPRLHFHSNSVYRFNMMTMSLCNVVGLTSRILNSFNFSAWILYAINSVTFAYRNCWRAYHHHKPTKMSFKIIINSIPFRHQRNLMCTIDSIQFIEILYKIFFAVVHIMVNEIDLVQLLRRSW